jgi:hypothetical protein
MSKINQILTEWVPGDIHSLSWFKERGIPQNLAYQYFKNGTLEKRGPGIYSRKMKNLIGLGESGFFKMNWKRRYISQEERRLSYMAIPIICH